MNLSQIVNQYSDKYLPHLSADIVIFGYKNDALHCLLLQFGDRWFLPGGHIEKNEDVGNAAERIVEARTALQRKFLHFFNVFGNGERSFSEDFKRIFQAKGLEIDQNHPMLDRYVTLGYIALVEMDSVTPKVGSFDDDIAWHAVNDLPAMFGDHEQIIRNAQEYLVGLNEFSPVGHHLLPEYFTMPQLHKLNQTITGRDLDRSRFQKKMLALDIYKRHDEITTSVRGRNPYLYSYDGKDTLERR